MKKIIIIAIFFVASSVHAVESRFGVGFINSALGLPPGVNSCTSCIDLGSLDFSYLIEYDSGLAAEVGITYGVMEDDYAEDPTDRVNFKIKTGYYLRGIYNFNKTFFVNATWLDTEIGGEGLGANNQLVTNYVREGNLGYGIGANIALPNSEAAVRISYEIFDFAPGIDIDQISIKYLF